MDTTAGIMSMSTFSCGSLWYGLILYLTGIYWCHSVLFGKQIHTDTAVPEKIPRS